MADKDTKKKLLRRIVLLVLIVIFVVGSIIAWLLKPDEHPEPFDSFLPLSSSADFAVGLELRDCADMFETLAASQELKTLVTGTEAEKPLASAQKFYRESGFMAKRGLRSLCSHSCLLVSEDGKDYLFAARLDNLGYAAYYAIDTIYGTHTDRFVKEKITGDFSYTFYRDRTFLVSNSYDILERAVSHLPFCNKMQKRPLPSEKAVVWLPMEKVKERCDLPVEGDLQLVAGMNNDVLTTGIKTRLALPLVMLEDNFTLEEKIKGDYRQKQSALDFLSVNCKFHPFALYCPPVREKSSSLMALSVSDNSAGKQQPPHPLFVFISEFAKSTMERNLAGEFNFSIHDFSDNPGTAPKPNFSGNFYTRGEAYWLEFKEAMQKAVTLSRLPDGNYLWEAVRRKTELVMDDEDKFRIKLHPLFFNGMELSFKVNPGNRSCILFGDVEPPVPDFSSYTGGGEIPSEEKIKSEFIKLDTRWFLTDNYVKNAGKLLDEKLITQQWLSPEYHDYYKRAGKAVEKLRNISQIGSLTITLGGPYESDNKNTTNSEEYPVFDLDIEADFQLNKQPRN